MNSVSDQFDSPWPHRLAVALVCATFPMIWIGGLVTTYGAGMAVPDWPNTYGYNLFVYPWQTWVFGPFKLFIEHGHRLLGTVVGVLAIALVISSWCCRCRPLVRWLSVAALAGVLVQGLLGGMRVLADEVQLAQIHGCVGPAFFAFTVAVATVTSRRWQEAKRSDATYLPPIERLALVTTFLALLQIVLGSQLRHLSATAPLGEFRLALFMHLIVATALLAHVVMLAARVLHSCRGERWLARPALSLAVLLVAQLILGGASWVTNYGFPAWLASVDFAAGYVATADGALQAWTTTAHVALGSMILATSLLVALRSMRLAARRSGTRSGVLSMGASL